METVTIITEQQKNNSILTTCGKNTTCSPSEMALGLAYERLNTKPSIKANETIAFIKESFPDLSEFDFIQVLKNGASGLYGATFRLSDQVICIWIRKYLESKKQPLFNENGVLSNYAAKKS